MRSYAFIDQLSYEAFNEGQKLEEQIQLYRSRLGFLPHKVLADRIYLNKNNCQYMESKDIIPIGKRLGRPPKQEKTEAELKEMHQRNEVEGTFGIEKYLQLLSTFCLIKFTRFMEQRPLHAT